MKKSLFAMAAVTAFAGAAQAQSSVTVYGIIDVGYGMANTRTASPTTFNASSGAVASTVNPQVVNTNYAAIGDSYQSTNRLGFRGNEDLGGGLSAMFTLEQGLSTNGSTGIWNVGSSGNRLAFVGLSQKGVGQVAIGTQNTTIQNAAALTDPGQLNNMPGNLVNDKFAPGATAQTSPAQTATTQAFAGNQNNTAFSVRTNNQISFRTANMAGFVGNAFYAFTGNTTDNTTVNTTTDSYTTGKTESSGYGVGLNYTWQKLLVTANYQSFVNNQPYTVTTAGATSAGTPAIGYFGGNNTPGTNVKDNQQYYAATYDFGILRAYVQYVARKATPEVSGFYTPTVLNRTAQQVGIRSNITPKVETWASVGNGAVTYYDTNKANTFGYQLGANYLLSKRTNLYAIYGVQSTSNAAITTGSTPVNTTSYNASGAAVGVRHTF
jgi:predicted porin